MRLLVITNVFPPGFAPRMGFLVKYFVRELGWTVDVVTESYGSSAHHASSFRHLFGWGNVYSATPLPLAGYSSGKNIVRDLLHPTLPRSAYLKAVFWKSVEAFRGEYHNPTFWKIVHDLIMANKYDAILSSSDTYTAACAAFAARASRITGTPFAADFRDIEEEFSTFDPKAPAARARIRRRNRALRAAIAVTSVTPGISEILAEQNPNVTTIYNGFDADIISAVEPARAADFSITYIGSCYPPPDYNYEFLGEVLERFITNPEVDPEKVRVNFYSPRAHFDGYIAPLAAARPRLAPIFSLCPMVQQTELPEIYAKSSVLLLVSGKTEIAKKIGAISSKMFEYVAVNRPVLVTDIGSPGVEKLLAETHAGLGADDVAQAADFLVEKYREWKTNGFTAGTADQSAVKNYSRGAQAEQFRAILEKIAADRRK